MVKVMKLGENARCPNGGFVLFLGYTIFNCPDLKVCSLGVVKILTSFEVLSLFLWQGFGSWVSFLRTYAFTK